MDIGLRGISSMATRALLIDLVRLWLEDRGPAVHIESVGGVDAVRRVEAGEPFDVVVLASDAIRKLQAGGSVRAGSQVDLVHSEVAIAVRQGAPHPDVSSEDAVRRAVEAATSIGYSTGPSGAALMKLFDRWGLAGSLRGRTVQAPPGVPVGTLVARGEVALGFQQLSELMRLQGIDVLGVLPPPIQVVTTFSAGVCATAADPETAACLLQFMASPDVAGLKAQHGMQAAPIHREKTNP